MRKFLPLLFAILLVCSCKKSNSTHPPTEENGWVSSIQFYATGFLQRFVDSFTYDGNHRIASYRQLEYDSSYGYPRFRTWSAIFTLPANGSQPPTGYSSDRTGSQEMHLLSYDAQGRIVRDSSLGASGWIIYFGYPPGKIAIDAFFNGSVSNSILDTLMLTNGNMAKEFVYQPNTTHTADSLQMIQGQTYSNLTNPFYHLAIVNSIGPLIHILALSGYGDDVDPISEKAYNSQSASCCHLPTVNVNYTQSTDSLGRLSQLSDGGGGVQTFRYLP